MKVKELIEELKKYNPDGVVTVVFLGRGSRETDSSGCLYETRKVTAVEDDGCALINPNIIANL